MTPTRWNNEVVANATVELVAHFPMDEHAPFDGAVSTGPGTPLAGGPRGATAGFVMRSWPSMAVSGGGGSGAASGPVRAQIVGIGRGSNVGNGNG